MLLYAESDIVNPVLVYQFDYLKNKTGRVWHCRIPLASMKGASYYAYSVEGPAPNGRFEWHGFDRDKILIDPYAKSVFFPPDFDRIKAVRPGSNAGKAPWASLRVTASITTGKTTIVPGTKPRPSSMNCMLAHLPEILTRE